MPEVAQTIWQWSLTTACFVAAAWMKWSGAYDDQAGGFRNDISHVPDGRRVRGGDLDRGATMKQAKNEDGQVIDFHAVRSARALHRWARERDMRTRTEVKT